MIFFKILMNYIEKKKSDRILPNRHRNKLFDSEDRVVSVDIKEVFKTKRVKRVRLIQEF